MGGAEEDEPNAADEALGRGERVTLKWRALPLLLPGEQASADSEPPGTVELSLPQLDDGAEGPGVDEAGELEPTALDGWSRERRTRAPPGHSDAESLRERPAPGMLDLDGDGDALSLVASGVGKSPPDDDLETEMSERFALGDFTAALQMAELILGRRPDHPKAKEISRVSEERLAALYLSRLGSLSAVPKPIAGVEVRWLGLDSRAAYLLSRIDGWTSLEVLIDLSGMSQLEVLRTIARLVDAGAVSVG